MPRGKVFGKWRKDQYIKNHIPTEFQTFAKSLSVIQLEGLSAAINFYRSRITNDVASSTTVDILRRFPLDATGFAKKFGAD